MGATITAQRQPAYPGVYVETPFLGGCSEGNAIDRRYQAEIRRIGAMVRSPKNPGVQECRQTTAGDTDA